MIPYSRTLKRWTHFVVVKRGLVVQPRTGKTRKLYPCLPESVYGILNETSANGGTNLFQRGVGFIKQKREKNGSVGVRLDDDKLVDFEVERFVKCAWIREH